MIKTFGKRILAMVVATAVVAGITVTYGIPNVKFKELDSSEPVVMTVNGEEIHADELRAYLKYNKMSMESMLSYYGNGRLDLERCVHGPHDGAAAV